MAVVSVCWSMPDMTIDSLSIDACLWESQVPRDTLLVDLGDCVLAKFSKRACGAHQEGRLTTIKAYLFPCVLLVMAGAVIVQAQTTNATLIGLVVDTSNAVVVIAAVEVTNEDTNV